MQTRLSMNQKPETDGTNWGTPKIDLKLAMESLALCLGKFQYQDLLLVLDAQERANNATRYLKYRPNLNEYAGHYQTWYELLLLCSFLRRNSIGFQCISKNFIFVYFISVRNCFANFLLFKRKSF